MIQDIYFYIMGPDLGMLVLALNGLLYLLASAAFICMAPLVLVGAAPFIAMKLPLPVTPEERGYYHE